MKKSKTRTHEEWRLVKTWRQDVALMTAILALAAGVSLLVEWVQPTVGI